MNWMKSWGFDLRGKRSGVVSVSGERPVAEESRSRLRTALFFAASLLTNLWAFLMTAVFPLYAPNQYFDLGEYKFQFFLKCSAGCLLPALVLLAAAKCCMVWAAHHSAAARGREAWKSYRGAAKTPVRQRKALSALDIVMCCYLAAVLVSFACSEYKSQVWTGAEGWYMGLRTQLLLAAAYICVSRCRIGEKVLLAGLFFGSGATFLLGILHRFRIDPLGMYEGISEKYFLEFLSTMGQASWFSSYICVVLPVGVACFFTAKKAGLRALAGAYCMLGFAAVVTQNSDSAFLAMGVLFLGLFVLSCGRMEWMERFLETLLLMLGSFKIVGILQQIFAERAMELDGISTFFSQSMGTWILLLLTATAYMLFLAWRLRHPEKEVIRAGRWLPWAAVGTLVLAIGGYVLAVWLNTAGLLSEQSQNWYLLFNYAWGNFRGFIWRIALNAYEGLSFLEKIFGAGPDGFVACCYANEACAAELNGFYGASQVLTNAHNEFLNTLICLGAVGLAAFLAIFVTAVRRFLGGACGDFGGEDAACGDFQGDGAVCGNAPEAVSAYTGGWQADPLILAGGLAALCYCAHNFFCYQQVCCTPFLVLLLALAENRMRSAGRRG